jgi:hypothetical protein
MRSAGTSQISILLFLGINVKPGNGGTYRVGLAERVIRQSARSIAILCANPPGSIEVAVFREEWPDVVVIPAGILTTKVLVALAPRWRSYCILVANVRDVSRAGILMEATRNRHNSSRQRR